MLEHGMLVWDKWDHGKVYTVDYLTGDNAFVSMEEPDGYPIRCWSVERVDPIEQLIIAVGT